MHAATREPGQHLGHYELRRPLGEGAMGEVWEATLHGPLGFRKPVALKLLRTGPVDDHARDALVREARVGALLQHPNVVAIFELGAWEGVWFVAMELVQGMSLHQLADAGPVPPPVVLDIGAQVCAGLAHLHDLRHDMGDRPLVHCDIKPGNILVDSAGLVKLADLGVASIDTSDRAYGTLSYVAPEQALGQPEPRSDLWSLGVVLYLLATRTLPFGRGEQALSRSRDVERLLDLPGFLGPVAQRIAGLDHVLRRCLRLDPDDRYPDAASLGTALRRLRWEQRDPVSLVQLLGRLRPDLAIGEGSAPPETDEVTLPVRRSRLPVERDALVGRHTELAQLRGWMAEGERFLTLMGHGGIGKTRLALALARRHAVELPGGAAWFGLAEATTTRGICAVAAQTLEIELTDDPVEQIGHALQARGRCIAVWDNLEQVVDQVTPLLGRWSELAPEAVMVCTTRVALRLRDERRMALGPLTVEDGVTLFEDRVPRPLADEERPHVAGLVAHLEGIPLALELAAARTRLVGVAELSRRLEDRLTVLRGGGRDRPARHRSMEASLDASWDLLSPQGRLALGQLAVFEGAFTLAAAEAVLDLATLPRAAWALDVLEELVDASLLTLELASQRFHMLVVVRAYTRTHVDADAFAATEDRHARWFAQHGAPSVPVPPPTRDLYDVIAACRHSVARGHTTVAVDACVAAWNLLGRTGPPSAAVELAESVLALKLPPPQEMRTWRVAGEARLACNHNAEALAAFEAGTAVARDEDGALLAPLLTGLAAAHDRLGEAEIALHTYLRAQAEARRHGDAALELRTLSALATLQSRMGRMADARKRTERALDLARSSGDRIGEGRVLDSLGGLAVVDEDPDAAETWLRQALAIHRENEDRQFEAGTLAHLGTTMSQQGRMDEAHAHLESALDLFEQIGMVARQGRVLQSLAMVHQQCGRWSEARACYRRATALAEAGEDLRLLGSLQARQATLCLLTGEPDKAVAHYEEAIALATRVGDKRDRCWTRANLALVLMQQSEFERASIELEQSLQDARDLHDPRLEGVMHHYIAVNAIGGFADRVSGRVSLARAEELLRAHGTPGSLARLLIDIGDEAAVGGDIDGAHAAYSESMELAARLAPVHRAELEQHIHARRAALEA